MRESERGLSSHVGMEIHYYDYAASVALSHAPHVSHSYTTDAFFVTTNVTIKTNNTPPATPPLFH